jgi:hypothetical protein
VRCLIVWGLNWAAGSGSRLLGEGNGDRLRGVGLTPLVGTWPSDYCAFAWRGGLAAACHGRSWGWERERAYSGRGGSFAG